MGARSGAAFGRRCKPCGGRGARGLPDRALEQGPAAGFARRLALGRRAQRRVVALARRPAPACPRGARGATRGASLDRRSRGAARAAGSIDPNAARAGRALPRGADPAPRRGARPATDRGAARREGCDGEQPDFPRARAPAGEAGRVPRRRPLSLASRLHSTPDPNLEGEPHPAGRPLREVQVDHQCRGRRARPLRR